MTKTSKTRSNESQKSDSKPAQLAKLIYGAIVRYTRARNAQIRAESHSFELDSDRKLMVNVHSNKID